MENHSQDEAYDRVDEKVWELLDQTKDVKASAFFSRNVLREVRQLEDSRKSNGFLGWLRAVMRGRPVYSWSAALSVVAILLICGIFFNHQAGDNSSVVGETLAVSAGAGDAISGPDDAGSTQQGMVSQASVDEVFTPSDELETVEYLGQLMAIADPGQLSDAALADLLF